MLSKLWAKEPVLVTLIGSAAFWPALFSLVAAFNHPFTDPQQHAIVGFVGVLAAIGILRSRVTPVESTDQKVSDATRSLLPAIFLACALGLGSATMPACASAPPAGTYTPEVTRTFNADQLTKDLIAAGQTARNLNATSGAEHLSDQDTVYIRDFSLIAGASLYAWGQGATTLVSAKAALDTLPAGYLPVAYLVPARAVFDKAITDHGAGASALYIVIDIYKTLRTNVSIDATKNPKLTALLGSIDAGIAAIPIQ